MPNNSFRSFVMGLTLLGVVSGCTNIDFKESASDFGASMSCASIMLNDYYSGLNAAERKVYLTRIKYSTTNEPVREFDKNGLKTGLAHQYSPQWLKAKTDTINLLSLYGSRLVALAGSSAPENVSTGIDALGTNLNTLGDQIKAISKSEKEIKFSKDVTTIVAVVGQMYTDHKRDQAIMEAVNTGYPAVSRAIEFLEQDLPWVGAMQSTGADDSLSSTIDYYNDFIKNKPKATLAERQAILSEVQSSAASYESVESKSPQSVLVAMRDALNAIVEYAKNPGGADSLVRLNLAIETFNNRVTPIAQSIHNMRNN